MSVWTPSKEMLLQNLKGNKKWVSLQYAFSILKDLVLDQGQVQLSW